MGIEHKMGEGEVAASRFVPPSQALRNERACRNQSSDFDHDHRHEPHFDERAYLAAFPDVSVAVAAGACESALAHYLRYGASEHRLLSSAYQAALGLLQTKFFPAHNIDQLIVTDAGYILVEGWVDDDAGPLGTIRVYDDQILLAVTFQASRLRRTDVEAHASIEPGRRVGFWALLSCLSGRVYGGTLTVSVSAGPYCRLFVIDATVRSLDGVRRRALALIASARRGGASAPEIAEQLDGAPGTLLGDIGFARSVRLVAGACCTRFSGGHDADTGRIRTSLVIRLDEGPQAIFLQAAMLANASHRSRFELVYVLGDPDLLEHVLREAASSAEIYAVPITIVSVAARLGFGAAMDAAVTFARGERLIALDHEIFPQGPGWLDDHDDIIRTRPFQETTIIGAMLGEGASQPACELRFEQGVAAGQSRTWKRRLVQFAVSPRWATPAQRAVSSRPAKFLAGHVVSLDRDTLERLGGFGHLFWSREASVAHLCFRAQETGIKVWEHRLRLLHLPVGRHIGSEHEAASLLDRCLFTSRWPEAIACAHGDPVPTAPTRAAPVRTIAQRSRRVRPAIALT